MREDDNMIFSMLSIVTGVVSCAVSCRFDDDDDDNDDAKFTVAMVGEG